MGATTEKIFQSDIRLMSKFECSDESIKKEPMFFNSDYNFAFENGGQELSEAEVMEVIIKQVKQRQDSATIYKEQGREDLFTIEMDELAILQELLPIQLTTVEVESVIARIISETGAASIKDMGKVMGAASKEMAGKTDNKIISEIVKRLLS